jgi:hypothetical protein
MTIGTGDLNNGSAKPERFSEKYRGARRDTAVLEEERTGDPLSSSDSTTILEPVDPPSPPPTLPSLDPNGLAEPVFPPVDWPAAREPLADHPLLRGLLLELPPKGTAPGPDWLNRWFEAARSILELLYMQETRAR